MKTNSKNNNALIGYSGFVGSNIKNQQHFEYLFDKTNISDIVGKSFDLVVCSGAPGVKWLANSKPNQDYKSIKNLISNIKQISAGHVVLISTIDVYHEFDGVNEHTAIQKGKLQPYGKHRRVLEEYVDNKFNSTIIRLPGIFGNGLRGNIIYDFLNNACEYIPYKGLVQLYSLDNIWNDISVAMDNNLNIINLATEPLSINEISNKIFKKKKSIGKNFRNSPYYNMHTAHGQIWGRDSKYLYSKKSILDDLTRFVNMFSIGDL